MHLCFFQFLTDNKAVECTELMLAEVNCPSTWYYLVFLLLECAEQCLLNL